MSREIRRMPLDFDWPLGKVWEEYLTPKRLQEDPCPDCYRPGPGGERTSGCGSTAAAEWVHGALYLIGMMAEDVRSQSFAGTADQFTRFGDDRSKLHPYLADLQRINVYEHRRPSADIIDLVTGITGRDNLSMGTGSDFAYGARKALLVAAGLPEDWGTCPTCQGHGSVEAFEGQRAAAEAYHEENHDPPTGEGWQVWETTSDGSPISPVFAEKEHLVIWLTTKYTGIGHNGPLTREQAQAFVEAGDSIATMVVIGGKLIPGDAAVFELSKDKDQ